MNENNPLPVQPPRLVVAATACMGASFTIGLGKLAIFNAHWERPATMIGFPIICLLLFVLIRALYRGHRWAFWVFVPLILSGICFIPAGIREMAPGTDRTVYIAQAILQGAAVFCLLLPASRRWFFSR
jgi:hypothetical protein